MNTIEKLVIGSFAFAVMSGIFGYTWFSVGFYLLMGIFLIINTYNDGEE